MSIVVLKVSGIDLENWVVHRIGMVACFISQIVQGLQLGAVNSL